MESKNNISDFLKVGLILCFIAALFSIASSVTILTIALVDGSLLGVNTSKTSIVVLTIILSMVDLILSSIIISFVSKLVFVDYEKYKKLLIPCVVICLVFSFLWLINIILLKFSIVNFLISFVNLILYLIGTIFILINRKNN